MICKYVFCYRRFHKDQKFIPTTNLANENVKSATQNFLSMYQTIKKVNYSIYY